MSGPPVTRARGLTSRPSSWARRMTMVRRGRALAHGRLGHGPVRDPADRPHVEPEDQVAHRGVAHDDGVHEPAAVDAQLRAEAPELVVERAPQRLAQLARELVVVRDAGHDVAAAEPLRVLERGDREDAPRLEVHELEHDGRRADVDRDADRAARSRRPRSVAVVRRDSGRPRPRTAGSSSAGRRPAPPGASRIRSRRRRTANSTSRSARSTRAWQASRNAGPRKDSSVGARRRAGRRPRAPPRRTRGSGRCACRRRARRPTARSASSNRRRPGTSGRRSDPWTTSGIAGESRGRAGAARTVARPVSSGHSALSRPMGSGPDAGRPTPPVEASVGSFAPNPPQPPRTRSPRYDRLTPADCARLHDASLAILERTGVVLHDAEAVERLARRRRPRGRRRAGARAGVAGRVGAVAWRRARSRSTTASGAPRARARGRQRLLRARARTASTSSTTAPASGARPSLADTRDGLTVVDALPNMDFGMSMFLPSDVPPEMADRDQMAVMLRAHDEAARRGDLRRRTRCWTRSRWPRRWPAARTALRERPDDRALHQRHPRPRPQRGLAAQAAAPRRARPARPVDPGDVGRARRARSRWPATSPSTTRASWWGSCWRSSSARATPVVDPGLRRRRAGPADDGGPVRRAGPPGHGAVARPPLRAADVQPRRRQRLASGRTSRRPTDAALTMLVDALAGGHLIHDSGYLESGLTGSLAQLAICDEIAAWIRAAIAPVEIDDETLALDLIDELGPDGSFLEARPHPRPLPRALVPHAHRPPEPLGVAGPRRPRRWRSGPPPAWTQILAAHRAAAAPRGGRAGRSPRSSQRAAATPRAAPIP